MKKILFTSSISMFILFWISCAPGNYPQTRVVQKAYKVNLKRMRTGYDHFVRVNLPLDSLGVK
ncbi:MAG: hypothetical protein ACRDE2_04265, partial [Chitinophagaceae bacterium]